MKYIHTDYTIPYYNMALEEYIMGNDKFSDEYLFFYIHKPSVIIGKYQNALSEVNMKYIEDSGIILARRITGGGAVYHDEGNLNFSFICRRRGDEIDFEPYVRPVIEALGKIGIRAELSGRNDLVLDGRKFGGNAQHMTKDKVLSHGTIMVDVNIENMTMALNVDAEKYISKGISSVRSRVVNIGEYMTDPMNVLELREYLREELSTVYDMDEYILTDEDKLTVEKLVREKFSTWEHNFGGRAKMSINKKKKLPAGMICISCEIKGGIITDVSIQGDFFANDDVAKLEDSLTGIPIRKEDIMSAVGEKQIIKNLSAEEIAELIIYG